MLKNFRNRVLAQFVLLALVGCPLTLHATLTCTNTIALGAGGFVLDSQITSRTTCVQAGDKLFGAFNFGNLPPGGLLSFSSNSTLNRASITFTALFSAGVTYNFGYQVEIFNSPNVITEVAGDVIQTAGTSSLLMTLTPTGTGAINFSKTGNVVNGPSVVSYTKAQGVTDLTVVAESFTKGTTSDSSAVLNTISQTPVPEPTALLLLSSGMLGLVSFRCRRFLKK